MTMSRVLDDMSEKSPVLGCDCRSWVIEFQTVVTGRRAGKERGEHFGSQNVFTRAVLDDDAVVT